MKKPVARLALTRETLLRMTDPGLRLVAGGSDPHPSNVESGCVSRCRTVPILTGC